METYLKKTGKAADAENCFRRAVSIYGKAVGGEDPDYANAMESLAGFYSDRREYDLAEPLLTRVLAIREAVFGLDHHDVAVSLDGLALLDLEQLHHSAAIEHYERALKIWEKILGADSTELSADLSNLSPPLTKETGSSRLPQPLLLRVLAIDRKGLSADSPDIGNDLNNLAILYVFRKRPQDALPLFQQALELRSRVLGPGAPETLETLRSYSAQLHILHRDDEARELIARIKAAGAASHPLPSTSH